MTKDRKKIANLLRLFADYLDNDNCELTDDDLQPMFLIISSILDIKVGYPFIEYYSGKPLNNIRSWVSRNVYRRFKIGTKFLLKDVLRYVVSK